MSWSHLNCEPGNGNEVHLWLGESRYAANMSYSRPKTAVRVEWDGFSHCSGTLLRGNWVLTAAHCVKDGNRVPIISATTKELKVHKDWVPNSIDAETYYINPSWASAGTDFDDDWALIKLESSFNGPDMDLSNAGDSTLQSVGPNFHNLGYPAFAPICLDTDWETVFHSPDNEVTAFQNVRLRWKGDGSPGQSGGALYYCPEGDVSVCGSGETGFVVSVWAGWNSVYDRWVGPRVSEWDDEAITIMNTW
jgi:hypothetical protein